MAQSELQLHPERQQAAHRIVRQSLQIMERTAITCRESEAALRRSQEHLRQLRQLRRTAEQQDGV